MENKDAILKESISYLEEILKDKLDNIVVERAVFGLFFSGVKLNNGYGGLCFTPIKEIPEAVCCPSSAKAMPLSGRLSNRSARKYLDDIFSGNILKRTLGIATLNALSSMCWDLMPEKDYEIKVGVDAFDELEVDPAKNSAVVGALVPMLKKLISANAPFKVFEMDSKTLKGEELNHFLTPDKAPEYLSSADLVAITGVTILNDTLEGLLSNIKEGAEVLVTGPTAGMLPDAFFKRGVTMIGGILVTKPDELLDIISEGGSGYHFFGKYAERIVVRKK